METTKTNNGYAFEHAGIKWLARYDHRQRLTFVDGPRDLMGYFITLEAAAAAFERYANKFADAEAIRLNPLTPADPDISHGTIIDDRLEKYGLPPTTVPTIPTSLTEEEALARLKQKLGQD
jgi:hypothetical protein